MRVAPRAMLGTDRYLGSRSGGFTHGGVRRFECSPMATMMDHPIASASSSSLDLPNVHGLSWSEAAQRLRTEGPNELPRADKGGPLATVREVLGQPMLVLFLLAGAVYVVLGDRQEAALLLASIGLIIGIELYQERRTERALEALRDLSSPRALVVRDGERRRIAGREVVRDDVVVLGEGDRVPADGVLLWSSHLEADESLLTGESAAVQEQAAPAAQREPRPSSDDGSHVNSGALITSGQGLVRETATGAATKMGRIGGALQSLRPEPTGLQWETDRVIRVVAVVAAAACLLMVVA